MPTSDSADAAIGQPDALEGAWPPAGVAGTLWHELLECCTTQSIAQRARDGIGITRKH
jgi:hypothetical protein